MARDSYGCAHGLGIPLSPEHPIPPVGPMAELVHPSSPGHVDGRGKAALSACSWHPLPAEIRVLPWEQDRRREGSVGDAGGRVRLFLRDEGSSFRPCVNCRRIISVNFLTPKKMAEKFVSDSDTLFLHRKSQFFLKLEGFSAHSPSSGVSPSSPTPWPAGFTLGTAQQGCSLSGCCQVRRPHPCVHLSRCPPILLDFG